jgi:hypothetical protein
MSGLRLDKRNLVEPSPNGDGESATCVPWKKMGNEILLSDFLYCHSCILLTLLYLTLRQKRVFKVFMQSIQLIPGCIYVSMYLCFFFSFHSFHMFFYLGFSWSCMYVCHEEERDSKKIAMMSSICCISCIELWVVFCML